MGQNYEAVCCKNEICGGKGVHLKGQLHIHTTFSDGRLTPQATADVYKGLGYDFIAYADHDHLLKTSYREAIEAVKTPMLVFFGIELTIGTRWGYVHVSMIEGKKEVLHTFNHPGENGFSVKHTLEAIEDVSKAIKVDAVEITHHGFYTPEYNTGEIPYPKVATDDSHAAMGCGRAWIELDSKKDKDSIIKAIKKGDFECCYARSQAVKMTIA
jgi:predicted metal-dependent phosphoesterase TrpH